MGNVFTQYLVVDISSQLNLLCFIIDHNISQDYQGFSSWKQQPKNSTLKHVKDRALGLSYVCREFETWIAQNPSVSYDKCIIQKRVTFIKEAE